MSIVAFKKKSVILYGSNVSGKPPGGIWLNRGPFGKGGTVGAVGPVTTPDTWADPPTVIFPPMLPLPPMVALPDADILPVDIKLP